MSQHPPSLLDDLDKSSVRVPTVEDLLSRGRAAKRRRGRLLAAGATVTTALVVAGSALGFQGTAADPDRDSDAPLVADSTVPSTAPSTTAPVAPSLEVNVDAGLSKDFANLSEEELGTIAVWNPQRSTLTFAPAIIWPSGCLPTAAADVGPAGTITLAIEDNVNSEPCRPEATMVTFTMKGLPSAPSELTVEAGGATSTIPVEPARGS